MPPGDFGAEPIAHEPAAYGGLAPNWLDTQQLTRYTGSSAFMAASPFDWLGVSLCVAAEAA